MSELMIHLIYPTSDGIFYMTTRTPTNTAEWTELEGKTLVLAEAANLLHIPRAHDTLGGGHSLRSRKVKARRVTHSPFDVFGST